MEERRWMLTASGFCWWFCLMTYFVQLDLLDLTKKQEFIAWLYYFVIGFGNLGYLYVSWFIATKLVLPGIPFLLGKTLVPPPLCNPNHPDFLGGDLEDVDNDNDEDPLLRAAMTFLALKLATHVLAFNRLIHSSNLHLFGFRIAQLLCVLSPFFVLNLFGVVREQPSDLGPALLSVGFTSLMGEGFLLIFGLECFKSFYGLLVAVLVGVMFITSRNNTVAMLIVCLMSALITCLCGVYLFLLSRIHNTGASVAAADDDIGAPSQASPPTESAV